MGYRGMNQAQVHPLGYGIRTRSPVAFGDRLGVGQAIVTDSMGRNFVYG